MQALAQCLWSIEERSDWGRRLCSGCDEPEVHMKSQGIDSIGQIVGNAFFWRVLERELWAWEGVAVRDSNTLQ